MPSEKEVSQIKEHILSVLCMRNPALISQLQIPSMLQNQSP